MGEPAHSLEARVAVLEQIARSTAAAIERIERRLEAIERRIDAMEVAHRADFRWLLGTLFGLMRVTLAGWASLLAVMAHGFHWY